MSDLSRRKMLGWTALAPLAGAATFAGGSTLARAAVAAVSDAKPTQSQLARQRIQRLHLPNVPLLTHEGKQVKFYDDLLKDKIVVFTASSPPGWRPKAISSRTAQAIHRSSVTRATAAKPMPVVRHTTSRIIGTTSILATAARSSAKLSVTMGLGSRRG